YAGVHKSIPENGFRAYNYIAHWLPYLNSSTNPIIYNFMSAKFRKEFFLACRCSYRITERSSSRPGMTFSSTHYSNHEASLHSQCTKSTDVFLKLIRFLKSRVNLRKPTTAMITIYSYFKIP
ncbi:Hypothetical predicted protein, partial [Mytilus galloprovincialis]